MATRLTVQSILEKASHEFYSRLAAVHPPGGVKRL